MAKKSFKEFMTAVGTAKSGEDWVNAASMAPNKRIHITPEDAVTIARYLRKHPDWKEIDGGGRGFRAFESYDGREIVIYSGPTTSRVTMFDGGGRD